MSWLLLCSPLQLELWNFPPNGNVASDLIRAYFGLKTRILQMTISPWPFSCFSPPESQLFLAQVFALVVDEPRVIPLEKAARPVCKG